MKIKVTHTFTYDTNDTQFHDEFAEYMDDHTHTLPALEEFVIDRFINPNFDMGGTTEMEIIEL